MSIFGNITHDFYISVSSFKGNQSFFNAVQSNFKNVCLFNESGLKSEPCFSYIQTVSNFLHGGNPSFGCKRCMLYDFSPQWEDSFELYNFKLMLSFFSDESILRISFHSSVKDAEPDFLIANRQSGANKKFMFTDGVSRSFSDIRDFILNKIAVNYKIFEKTFLLEINEWNDYGKNHMNPVSFVRENYPNLLYGFLTGDEGWKFVPEDTVNERLKCNWSSREFMRIFSFGPSFLFFNFNDGISYHKYLERQHEFGEATYGGVNEYFLLPSCPLTVNHGIMHSCEFVLVVKSIVDRVYFYHSSLRKNRKFAKSISTAKNYRSEILAALNKIENVQISEIGELDEVILKSQNISPVIEKVKSLLDLLESELDLAYSTRTNTMVTLLTVLGLLLTATGIIVPLF